MESFLARKAELLELTDPDRIYVENIRSIFNLPTKIAKLLCELAVKSGQFEKRYGVKCPNCSRLIKVYNTLDEIPQNIKCLSCEVLEVDRFEFNRAEFDVVTFYRLRR
ncbi:hypothetical protein ASG33_08295 [Dyadobacter sp. Leaf189]|nr:hypothetical protein ASG33_08295 [Dyadobacter sp. Leaf189]